MALIGYLYLRIPRIYLGVPPQIALQITQHASLYNKGLCHDPESTILNALHKKLLKSVS